MHDLLDELEKIHRLTLASKPSRILSRPLKYIKGHGIKFISNRNKKAYPRRAKLFFGTDMLLKLPSGLDIYLFGAKTHDSEIRLAKFLIRHLEANHIFFDVGAHYGYFSLLADQLDCAKVVAFEASENSFNVLEANTKNRSNITAIHAAVCEEQKEMEFFEFPPLYAENNTLHVGQFQGEAWIARNTPRKISVPGITLDSFIRKKGILPDLIKIDVEGAELEVISGLSESLEKYPVTLVLEFIFNNESDSQHLKAYHRLTQLHYRPYLINNDGSLDPIPDIAVLMAKSKCGSENIVFKK